VNKTTGNGTITASSGSAKGSISAEVVNKLDEIKLSNTTMMVDKNGSFTVQAEGYLNGRKVVDDPSIYAYSVSGNLGTVENGIFKAGNVDGEGTVTVAYGSVTSTFNVRVGNPGPVVLEDFEGSLSTWKASGAHYQSALVTAEKNYVKEGKQSLKVAYDFIGTTGTSGIYAAPSAAINVPGTPEKIGMWVYGDAKGHWLRAELVDANNQSVQLDFTKDLDWIGWKYVEAVIPSGLTSPYKLVTPVRYMEVNDLSKNKGQIFIDKITAIYPNF